MEATATIVGFVRTVNLSCLFLFLTFSRKMRRKQVWSLRKKEPLLFQKVGVRLL